MDIASLVNTLMEDGTVRALALNAAAQFGVQPRRYIGAELLPERTVPENAYREDAIRYRTIIANSGTRYSPTQKKGGDLMGSFLVELGNSDIARELNARDYDALIRLLNTTPSMDGTATLLSFADRVLNLALVEYNEKQRWEAIVNASVVRVGDNAYSETIAYPNPANHRAAAGGTWSSDAYDPFNDILAMADLLEGKGFSVGRIITSRAVVSILSGNDKVKTRTGVATINTTGQIAATPGRASRDRIDEALMRDGLPPIETYDLLYHTQAGSGRFLPAGSFVLVATTGRDETIELADAAEDLVINDTLGYVGVGRATGQAAPGRVIRMESKQDKPPRVEGEAWQTSLPVITEPEAVAVITGIA
jgi:hypothetical protein